MSVELHVIAAIVDEGSPKKKLTEIRLAYLSGLFDGEGCVKFYMVIPKNRTAPSPRRSLTLGNVDWRIPRLFHYYFGGKLSPYQTHGRQQMVWRAHGPEADRAAALLSLYCVSKKSQLDLFIEATTYLRYDRRHLSDDARRMLVEIAEQIKELKWMEGGDWS